MKTILFVCLGNICRSPMSEFVMKELVKNRGLSNEYYIESAATSTWELGNPVYPPAKAKLESHGIHCDGKYARQMTKSDYDRFDYLIGMDRQNLMDMRSICGGDPLGKIHLLTEYSGTGADVADPWYTGNFEETWQDVLKGCTALLELLQNQ